MIDSLIKERDELVKLLGGRFMSKVHKSMIENQLEEVRNKIQNEHRKHYNSNRKEEEGKDRF